MFKLFKKDKGAGHNKAFERISEILTSDDMQIRILGPDVYGRLSALSAIDKVPNPEGEFGIALGNPIPTNGPIGSLSYISSMTTEAGSRLLFHRIKAHGNIDVFEYVSMDSSSWGYLFVDMYHSRKSKILPKGFVKPPGSQQLTGFNHMWDSFPYYFGEQKQKLPSDIRLLYAPTSSIEKEMVGRKYIRPELHAGLGAIIMAH